MLYGIDISAHQIRNEKLPDFDLIAAANKSFVVLRASVGEGRGASDTYFLPMLSQCKRVGRITGAYHFCTLNGGVDSGKRQALAFVEAAESRVDLPLMLDFESLAPGDTWKSYQQSLDIIDGMIETIERETSRTPGIYVGANFLPSFPASWKRCPLWIQQYNPVRGTTIVEPKVPPPWEKWTFHQYAANPFPKEGIAAGACDGIEGPVDLNRFSGTWQDLMNLCGYDLDDAPTRPSNPSKGS